MWPVIFLVGVYTGKKCPYLAEPVMENGDLVWQHAKKIWNDIVK